MENYILDEQQFLERAEFSDRFIAWFYDMLIAWLPLAVIFISIWYANRLGDNFYFRLTVIITFFIEYIWYFAICPYYENGQTIGKRMKGIRITTLSGEHPTLGHFIIRELITDGVPMIFRYIVPIGLYADIWSLTYLLALSENRRTLVDIIVGTQVVKVEEINN